MKYVNKYYLFKEKLKLFPILFLLICLPLAAAAQSRPVGRINLLHTAGKGDDLPYPGTPITISVTLENTKNSQLVLKGFFVRDGKVIEQNLTDFSTDENDRLVYSTTIHAPLAELNYQFALMDGPTAVSHSKRYSMRRSCLPNVEGVSAELPADTQARDKVKLLQIQATALQNEIQNYESAFKLLDELKILTEK